MQQETAARASVGRLGREFGTFLEEAFNRPPPGVQLPRGAARLKRDASVLDPLVEQLGGLDVGD